MAAVTRMAGRAPHRGHAAAGRRSTSGAGAAGAAGAGTAAAGRRTTRRTRGCSDVGLGAAGLESTGSSSGAWSFALTDYAAGVNTYYILNTAPGAVNGFFG